jgi:hypothetical protein
MSLPIDVTLYTNYGKISSFLAASDFAKQRLLKGSAFNTYLPQLLSVVTDLVEWKNDLDPDDETLVDTANYLYQLCGRYIPKAKQLIGNMGQGTIVNPANGVVSILAPIYLEFYVGVTASPVMINGVSVVLPSVGDASMTLPLTFIKQSLEIELDGISVPRSATDRISANVNYTNDDATITLGPAGPPPVTFQYNQLWVISGDQYQAI